MTLLASTPTPVTTRSLVPSLPTSISIEVAVPAFGRPPASKLMFTPLTTTLWPAGVR